MKMIKVKIPRKKWLRGARTESLMLSDSGASCCLGHVAKACGISSEMLLGRGTPRSVCNKLIDSDIATPRSFKRLVDFKNDNSSLTIALMGVNDLPIGRTLANDIAESLDPENGRYNGKKMTAKLREKIIKESLKKIGFDVKFV